MQNYDYIFRSDLLAQMMKTGRAQQGRNWTQPDLVSHLSSHYSGCGPDLQLSTIKRIEGAREGETTGVGILSAIKIAKALGLPLPRAMVDDRIFDFALDLVLKPESACGKCDAMFAQVLSDDSNWGKNASWDPIFKGTPGGTLHLLPAFFQSSGPVRLTIRSRARLHAFESSEMIDQSGVLPVDLIPFLEKLGEDIFRKAKLGNIRVDRIRPSGFWRHVPSGQSENIGVDRLAEEISQYEKGVEQCDPSGDALRFDLRYLIVAAFSNLFDLVLKVKERSDGVDIPENFIGYVNGYTMLLRLSDKPYAHS